MRESIYLSFNKERDWDKGVGSMVSWENGTIQLSHQKNYILESVIDLKAYPLSDKAVMLVSNAGMIYLIEENSALYALDWHLKQLDLIDADTGLSEEDIMQGQYFAANNRIYYYKWSAKTLEIKIYSLLNRQWIYDYRIECDTDIHAVCVNERLIGIMDKSNVFSYYRSNKGEKIGSKSFTEDELPMISELLDIHILGTALQLIYKGNQVRSIKLMTKPILISTWSFESTLEAFSGNLISSKLWGRKDSGTTIWCNNEMWHLDVVAEQVYNDARDYLYLLMADRRIQIYNDRYVHKTGLQQKIARGVYYFPVIDSKVEGNQWHRMILNGNFPEKSHINSQYVAFDIEKLAANLRKEAKELVEKKELDFEGLQDLFETLDYQTIDDSDDFLFQESYGRYLLIRLELIGSRDITPSLEKVRVYINRETYSQYLPEIYQTGGHKDFIERFLSIFESLNIEIEEQIDQVSRNFNPNLASDEFLRWMVGWMDFTVDDSWTTEQLRELIQLMPALNRRRGTTWAIERLLELFLVADIKIIENSKILSNTTEGTEESLAIAMQHYGKSPYGFTVLSYRKTQLSDKERQGVKAILDQETPPYCQYNFIELKEGLFLDKHTYLGVNTYLSDYSNFMLNNETLLPFNTLLLEE